MCLCGNLGLLKESGQYSTLAPQPKTKNEISSITSINVVN